MADETQPIDDAALVRAFVDVLTVERIEENFYRGIATPQEVCVQGIHRAFFHRAGRSEQPLPQNLTTEHLGGTDVTALPLKDVVVQLPQFEQRQ